MSFIAKLTYVNQLKKLLLFAKAQKPVEKKEGKKKTVLDINGAG